MIQKQPHETDNKNYGQMFILAGFLIAIIITLMAFSLNLVIYSENTSARGSAVAEERVLDHIDSVNMTNERIMSRYNRDRTYSESDIQNIGLGLIERTEEKRQQTNGALSEADYSHTSGTAIAQYSNKKYYPTDSQTQTDWAVVTGEPEVYYAQQRVDPDKVNEYGSSTISSTGLALLDTWGTEFSNSSGDSYTAVMYKISGEDTLRLRVQDSSGSFSAPCDVSPITTTVTVDYMENTINGTDCPPLSNITQSNWDISYENVDGGGGTYAFVTSADPADINSNIDKYQSGGSDPYYANQVTSITVDSTYIDSESNYQGQVRLEITDTDLEYLYTP